MLEYKFKPLPKKIDFVSKNLIFMSLAGSHLYGTNTEQSDIDLRGVCVPPKNVVIGFAREFTQHQVENEDTIVYGLSKFMNLAVECNPNIIELLFSPPECIINKNPLWDELLEHKYEFLSAKAYHTFSGYAFSQLQKISSHRRWLVNPPTHKPTREEYGLSETSNGVKELSKGIGIDLYAVDPELLKLLDKEKNYKSALTLWNQYEEWKSNRNEVRLELEKKYGLDTKHASHLVRLLRMGKEILIKGDLQVRRSDAKELLEIRNGKFTYDELLKYSNDLIQELKSIYDNKKYVVQYSSDREAISDLCVELHEKYWNKQ